MENFKEKLHPITVWGIYAKYLARDRRERRLAEWKSVWKFDPDGDMPNNEIVKYARIAGTISNKLK